MSPLTLSLIVFICVFGGALAGIALRAILPEHHLSTDSRDVVKLGAGLVGTMAALVLGLMVASAKDSYDGQKAELTQLAGNIALLDRILEMYGSEAAESRGALRSAVDQLLTRLWPSDDSATTAVPDHGGEIVYEKIQGLSPKNELQRALQNQAAGLAMDIGKARWTMYEQATSRASVPLLVVLVLWLSFIFMSFGLFAPFNGTVVFSLFVSAVSVSGAILLILEMYKPYSGLIKISSEPLRAALQTFVN